MKSVASAVSGLGDCEKKRLVGFDQAQLGARPARGGELTGFEIGDLGGQGLVAGLMLGVGGVQGIAHFVHAVNLRPAAIADPQPILETGENENQNDDRDSKHFLLVILVKYLIYKFVSDFSVVKSGACWLIANER
jgi:hypothetical protein